MAKTQVKRIRASLIFTKQSGNALMASATPVADGLIANSTIFATPPVDGPTVKTQTTTYSASYNTFVTDGGKKAIADKNKQEHVLIEMLRKDAHYVEGACNQDMATFLLSGFQANTIGPVTPQPVGQTTFVSATLGASGTMVVKFKAVPNAKVYQIQEGISVNGAAPTSWTQALLPHAKPATIPNLTPGTTYQFQVRAYGTLGWGEWSDPVTRMAT
jgi:Fibronectin type III domain